MLYLRVFGGLTLEHSGRSIAGAAVQRSRLALLTVLAAANDKGISRDRLLALFWPDKDFERAQGALRQALYALRKDVGEPDLVRGTTHLSLNPAIIRSDLAEFDAAMKARRFEQAVELYAGPLLEDVELRDAPDFDRWLEEERSRRAAQYRSALDQRVQAAEARGDLHAVVEMRKRLAASDPLRSSHAIALMRALVRIGEPAAALQHARAYERLLRDELDVAPEESVTALSREIRASHGTSGRPTSGDPPDRAVTAPEPSRRPTEVESAPLPTTHAWNPRTIARLSIAFAAAGLVVAGLWLPLRALARQIDGHVPLAPHRVAVATFLNRTGDPSLDPLGPMAADWIARGLAATGVIDVAGTAEELQSRAGVTIAPGPGAVQQLGREARAGLVVSGAFYRRGDSLLFQADFTDAQQGRLLRSVGPFAAAPGASLEAIEKLRSRVTAALAPFLDSTLAGIAEVTAQPPSFDAYREMLRAEELFYSDEPAAVLAYRKVRALEPAWVFPLLREIMTLRNAERLREADVLVHIAETRRASMTPYEAALLDLLVAGMRENMRERTDALLRMWQTAPRSDFVKYLYADQLNITGKPHGARALLEQLDPHGGALRGRPVYYVYSWRPPHVFGEHHRALEIMRHGREQYPDRMVMFWYHARALAVLGRGDEARALLDSIARRPMEQDISPVGIAISAVREARAHDRAGATRSLRSWLSSHLAQSATPVERAEGLAELEEWTQLRAFADSMTRRREEPRMLSFLTLAAAKLGDTARARDADRRLNAISWPKDIPRYRLIPSQALAAASLGERERAVALLAANPQGGWNHELWHGHPLFHELRTYPPFQALLIPRD